MAITRIQTIYVAADDVARTASFYEALFDAAPRFRDGDKWVQFSIGGTGFAVASPAEAAAGVMGAVTVFEASESADHDRLVASGAVVLETRDMGDHGRTQTYRDPAGNLLQLFWKANNE